MVSTSPFRDEEMARKDARISELNHIVRDLEDQLKEKEKQEVRRVRRKNVRDFIRKPIVVGAIVVALVMGYIFMIGYSSNYLARNCEARRKVDSSISNCHEYYAASIIWPISMPCAYGARVGEK